MNSLEKITKIMKEFGAERIIFKKLANNDNSKQQIYLGSEFSVVQDLPLREIKSDGIRTSCGAIFKAAINLFWIMPDGKKEQAKKAQIILYPRYPEIRLSGVLAGCSHAPSHLMKPPSLEERKLREDTPRFLILGINNTEVYAYISAWDDVVSQEIISNIKSDLILPTFSVFYEYASYNTASRVALLSKLKEIFHYDFIRSRRLNKSGEVIDYKARNGAGFTLESFFGIIPNGSPEPDFLDWELKAHSGGAVTLMTPEPDLGLYVQDVYIFMQEYASSKKENRIDFASIHKVGMRNDKTNLELFLEGYDLTREEITDPSGGLVLRDSNGVFVAGWTFEKLLNHWKRKHSKTCFVSYVSRNVKDDNYYHYGPKVTLATGAELKKFFNALANANIYYDPGINIKYIEGKSKLKRRNQFRIKWKDINGLYTNIEEVDLTYI